MRLDIYQNKLDKACFRHCMAHNDLKSCMITHLILLRIRDMMNIKEVLLKWFINCLIKSRQVVVLKVKLCQTNN